MYGTATPMPGAAITGTDLGLYSITFNNDLDADIASLEAFAEFRAEAAECGFNYFLEVFNPNVETGIDPEILPHYINDNILRCLAGVHQADRPQFLKIVYNGPKALEELASFDPSVIVGVLGGGAGTTRDCFELLHQAEKYGARVALFGRKINLAEAPLAIVAMMREVVDGNLSPQEAVQAYHGELQKQRHQAAAPARGGHGDHRGRAAAAAVNRRGIICGGSILVDVNKLIDRLPPAEDLAVIQSETADTGGPGLNMAVDLARLGCGFPVQVVGLIGDDAHGRLVLDTCGELGIDTAGIGVPPGVPTSYTDVMIERDTGRRTFFHYQGANALLDPEQFDFATAKARIFHLGAPGVHERMDGATAAGNGFAEVLARARAAGLRTNLELVCVEPERIRELALPCLPHLDTIIVNELEAAAVTGKMTHCSPRASCFGSVCVNSPWSTSPPAVSRRRRTGEPGGRLPCGSRPAK